MVQLLPARWACAVALSVGALAATGAAAAPPAAPPRFVFSAYKYSPLGMQPGSATMREADGGDLLASLSAASDGGPAPVLTWSFATGECGAETWADRPGQAIADANLPAFQRAGIGYIISTGGQGGVFTCGSDAGMERFIARYLSPQLIGLDFDIEAGQSPAAITALAQRLAVVRQSHPQLRLSFTLATFAASDGSQASLNATGVQVLAALRSAGVDGFVINLMVMDFGKAESANCVVRAGRCDMAASARQAAQNASVKYQLPLTQIELTPMIGMNDVVDNVYTADDALATARYVREQHLAGLHYWSFDRDRPCPVPQAAASDLCHGAPGPARYGYYRAFAAGLR